MNQEDAGAIILDHYRKRQYFSELSEPRLWGEQVNHACGDEITLYLRLGAEKTIMDMSYIGRGCSICIASADILCHELIGKDVNTARSMAEDFIEHLHGRADTAEFPGHIPALLTLKDYPIRRKCALMSWQIVLDML